MKITLLALVNNKQALKSILLQSETPPRLYVCEDALSAAEGFNRLLRVVREDVALICHQDTYLPPGFIATLEKRLDELPDDWMVAGFYGINEFGEHCGKIHDRRVPTPLITKHKLPAKALSVDGCCMALNMDEPFLFNEDLVGFDLYDTYACLKARERGRTAWIVDCMPEHYPTRHWDWRPDTAFMKNWNNLKKWFPKELVISTCYDDRPQRTAQG